VVCVDYANLHNVDLHNAKAAEFTADDAEKARMIVHDCV